MEVKMLRKPKKRWRLQMMYYDRLDEADKDYAWADGVVWSDLHHHLHPISYVAGKILKKYLGHNARWALGRKRAFHFSFRSWCWLNVV